MRTQFLAAALLTLAPVAQAAESSGLYVLAINGGGDKLDNFASHLAHLRQLTQLLAASGIPRDHITVLASDGSDPAPDLATRESEPENAWLLQGTRVDPLLRDLTTYEDSVLPGIDLRPATVASLRRTIGELRGRLQAGDTLLVYVTDHGTQSRRDPIENRITLWGAHESISVRKLGTMLARLPPSVRVVSLMSQCYSGGFAYLHEAREHKRLPSGKTCGYFSSTPDRPAYGCYPEVRGQKAIGHSFEFLTALARRGRFSAAQTDILVSDETPDIPLRSSDVYLAEQIAHAAASPQRESAFADPLVRQAFAGRDFVEESRLLDRIAQVFAFARPSSLAELDERAHVLFAFLDQLELDGKTWESALGDFNQANLEAFLAGNSHWRGRLADHALRGLDGASRRSLALELLADLALYVMSDPVRLAQANRLLAGLTTTDEISYRSEIRVAALMRARFIFTSVAGRMWSKRDPHQVQAIEALTRCEDLALPVGDLPRMAEAPTTAKLPPLTEDQRRATAARPGWLGITFVPLNRDRRKKLGVPDGAAQITSILSRSPAAAAGLRSGDIVLGPPTRPLPNPRDLRPLIASATTNVALPLEVLRGKSHMVLRPVVGQAPVVKARN
ncbi:MAG TPA: PDZ domain-containing protein [Polyangia bacterium]